MTLEEAVTRLGGLALPDEDGKDIRIVTAKEREALQTVLPILKASLLVEGGITSFLNRRRGT